MEKTAIKALFNFFIFSFFIITNLFAEKPFSDKTTRTCGALHGYVYDQDSNDPVSGVQILLTEITRSGMTHEDGHFYIPELPLGSFTLRTFRIGYQSILRMVTLNRCDTNQVIIKIKVSPLTIAAIHVDAQQNSLEAQIQPDVRMTGKKLRQQLGGTIAETIDDEPGLEQRTMGPAPARPVLRGLSGDRLLVLEDNERTGDLSATSADHAVVIEPMTAERIEVIRGPAALLFGPNTLGGVINVARGYIPTTGLDHMHGTFTYQGESVNRGSSGGMAFSSPLGPLSFRMDGSLRSAGDMQTPIGKLMNTAISTQNISTGLSLAQHWGFIGVAGSFYNSNYGIPGGFVGAHPKGVDIDLERRHFEVKSQLIRPNQYFNQFNIHGTYSRYFHQEFESSGIVGIEYGLLTYNFSATAQMASKGRFQNGKIGFWSEYRDYASGGFAFTPPTIEQTHAGFVYQEINLDRFIFQGSIRFDHRTVTPEYEKESQKIGLIHQRIFSDFSAALAGLYRINNGYFFGARMMRSFRAPGIEELFSEGPHLAAYAFEIGNPELNKETGLGLEAFVRMSVEKGRAEITFFRNNIKNYIFPKNTGQLNYRTLLPTYQFTGLDAEMIGGEASFEYELFPGFAATVGLSYVKGELTDLKQPLPWMPPLSGKMDLHFTREKYSLGLTVNSAAEQNRLGEFEERTAAFATLDFTFQYFFSWEHFFNSIDFVVANVTNTEYRKHLSRVKSIMPEPGRNFKLLYRVYF